MAPIENDGGGIAAWPEVLPTRKIDSKSAGITRTVMWHAISTIMSGGVIKK